MTSVVTSAGSPLDDYFRDEGESVGSSLETESKGVRGTVDVDDGDVTLVSPDTSPDIDNARLSSTTLVESPRKGWTGVIESVAGPSCLPSPTLPGHFDPSFPGQSRAEDEFAERFKYIICSSGTLEKDYVPGLAGTGEDFAPPSVVSERQPRPSPKRRETLHRLRQGVALARRASVELKRKWDIALAGAVALIGLIWLSGYETILWIILIICVAWGAEVILHSPTGISVSRDSYRSDSLDVLSSLLAGSREIDATFDNAISLLSNSPTEDGHHDLRLALHRATSSLVDHFATATSNLSTLINHSELAVLADMYDVQLGPTTRTKPTHLESSEEEDIYDPASGDHSLDIDATQFSPSRRLRIRKAARSLYASTSMSISQSSPGRFRESHMRHLSLASSATLPRLRSNPNSSLHWTPRDRFTSLPPRTPRESKRISLDPAIWDRVRNGLDDADDAGDAGVNYSPTSPSKDRARFPDIPEVDGSSGMTEVMRMADENHSEEVDGFLSEPMGSSPTSSASNVHRYSPFRTSPLANRSPSGSERASPIFPSISAQLLPTRSRYSLPVTTSESKRRSLQNMPYYSDDQKSPTKSIARIRTRPSSDLQELRSRSSGGYYLTRLSMSGPKTAPIGLGLPSHARLSPTIPSPTRHRRTTSTAPLSLTSLKASCLAVHLKRRRLVCCLLGLRFDERHLAYWEEVRQIVRTLCASTSSEMEGLRAAIEVTRESGRQGSDMDMNHAASFVRQTNRRHSSGPTDFAPRQTPEDILLERIEAIRGHLASLWGEVDDLKTRLQSGDEVGDRWMTMREQMREITREWEKGRAAASLLESHPGPSDPVVSSEEASEGVLPLPVPAVEMHGKGMEDMPEFLRSWSNESSSSYDAQNEDDNTTPPTGSEDDPELPLPGIDQVFESDLSALPIRGASNLTREERIKLVKEAREKGLNVSQATRAAQSENGVVELPNGGRDDNEAMVRGGEVVEELKGMIGLIRQRKGLDVPTDTPVEGLPPPPTEPSVSIADAHRPQEKDPAGDSQTEALTEASARSLPHPTINGQRNRSSPVVPPAAPPSNILFPSEDLRKAFVFPALERHPTD